MGAVHVRIGHDHDLFVAQVVYAVGVDAQGEVDGLDLLVGEDLLLPRLLDVEDLAPQGQDGLGLPVAPLFGGAAGGIALDYVKLPELGVRTPGSRPAFPAVCPPRRRSCSLSAPSPSWPPPAPFWRRWPC